MDESQKGITAFRRLQAENDRDVEFDLFDLAVVLRRGWLTILATMALMLGLTEYYLSNHHRPAFAARAELVAEPGAFTRPGEPDAYGLAEAPLSSQVDVIMSRANLQTLAEQLDLVADPALRVAGAPTARRDTRSTSEGTIAALSEAITVEREAGSDVLVIRTEVADADLARTLANTLANIHIAREFSRKTEKADRYIAALSAEMDGLETEIRQRVAEKDTVIASPEVEKAFRAMEDLAHGLRNMRDISAAMNGVAQTATRAPSPAQTARLEEIETQIGRILETRPLQALQQLERNLEVLRRRQTNVSEEYLSLRAHRPLLRPGMEVLSYATGAVEIGPRPSLLRIIALTTGAILGASALLWRRFVHAGIRTRADLAPLCRGTPLIDVRHSPCPRRKTLTAVSAGGDEVAASEGVRDLRATVLRQYRPGRGSAIMLTASQDDEGVTTLAVALAHGLAALSLRVLLIEGDLRRPSLAARLDVEIDAGLDEVLTGFCRVESAVVQLQKPEPRIVCAGYSATPADVASDLLATPALGDLVAEARPKYDFIIVSAPPVLGTSDARLIARAVDAAIYVVEWDRTRREKISEGLAALAAIPIPLAACVINKIRPRCLHRLGY